MNFSFYSRAGISMIGLNLNGFSESPGSLLSIFCFSDPYTQGFEGAISLAIFIQSDRLKLSGTVPDSHCPVGAPSISFS